MPSAYTLVSINDAYHRVSVRASLHSGDGELYIAGPVGQEIKNVLYTTINTIGELASYDERCNPEIFAERNLYIRMVADPTALSADGTVPPIVGASYGLALSMAILAAATNRQIPSEVVFTGCNGPAAEILPVEDIYRKRSAARHLGFARIVLPGSQLDMMSSEITQCPVQSIMEAYSVTFYGEET